MLMPLPCRRALVAGLLCTAGSLVGCGNEATTAPAGSPWDSQSTTTDSLSTGDTPDAETHSPDQSARSEDTQTTPATTDAGAEPGPMADSHNGRPTPPAGLVRYMSGDPADKVVTPQGPGLVLMGGGVEVDQAFQWWRERLAGGDIVVLRTSGSDGYQDYLYQDIGGCDSVETLLVDEAWLASDDYVVSRVREAEGIWLAGGDQARYMRLWPGTPLSEALNEAWERGALLGGTSAGCAVLGQFIFAAYNDTVYSEEAQEDPYNVYMTLDRDFLSLAPLAGVITDTHFSARERQGRLVAFLARIIVDGWSSEVLGLGLDEETALVIDATGQAAVMGDGNVSLMRSAGAPTQCEAQKPLSYEGLKLHVLKEGDTLQLPSGDTSVPSSTISVIDGVLELDTDSAPDETIP